MGVQVPLRAQGKTPGIQGFQGFFSVSDHASSSFTHADAEKRHPPDRPPHGFVAYIEDRERKDGSVTYYVRWIDPDTRQRMWQKMDSADSANFETTPSGQHVVKVVRAWTRDKDNVPYVGPPKTKQSKRTVALTDSVFSNLQPLLHDAATSKSFVFVNTAGTHLPHNRAWDAWDLAVSP